LSKTFFGLKFPKFPIDPPIGPTQFKETPLTPLGHPENFPKEKCLKPSAKNMEGLKGNSSSWPKKA